MSKADADVAAGAPSTAAADPGLDVAALAEGMTSVRSQLQTIGTTFGAAVTAVLAGLGYTQLNELFPLPGGKGWVAWIAVAGAVLAVGGAAWFTIRLFRAQRRILISSASVGPWTEPGAGGVTEGPEIFWEKTDLRSQRAIGDVRRLTVLFRTHAAEENARSVYALDLRASRLARAARRLSNTGHEAEEQQAARLQAESDRLQSVVRLALMRGAVTVLESRARNVLGSGWTAVPVGLTLAGVILLWGAADYSKGQRDLVALRKDCAAAVEAKAANACDSLLSETERTAAAKARAAAKTEADKKAAEAKKATDAATAVQAKRTAVARLALSPAERKAVAKATRCERTVAAAKLSPATAATTVQACIAATAR